MERICPMCSGSTDTYRHPNARVWCEICGFIVREEGGKMWYTDEIARLRAENKRFKQLIKDTVSDMECLEACDSYGHDDNCPVANPEVVWRQLREEIERLRVENEELKKTIVDQQDRLQPLRALADEWKYRQSCNNQDAQTQYAKAKAHIYGICANELEQVANDGND